MVLDDSASAVSPGERVHVVTRPLFEGDVRRHFVGECTKVTENTIRVEGYAFIYDTAKNGYERRPEKRTRVFSLSDGNLIITVLAGDVAVDSLKYARANERLVLTDGKSILLDINEFGAKR